MRTAICTISSKSHLFKTNVLFDSLKDKTQANLYCLLTDGAAEKNEVYHIDGLDTLTSEEAKALKRKYTGDKLRWGLKSVYLQYLLLKGYDGVIYVDNDICFYGSPDFLFEKLKDKNVLLTPHYYPHNPKKDPIWLEANYRVGLYNAGFIGVNKKAIPMLNWWAEACCYNIKKSFSRGLFDDQKYLDLVPVLFDGVEILKHKGCNVAGWNIETSPRSVAQNGEILLDGVWPLIFVHYNYYTIECIQRGNDYILKKYGQDYLEKLIKNNPKYQSHQGITSRIKQYYSYIRFSIYRMLD